MGVEASQRKVRLRRQRRAIGLLLSAILRCIRPGYSTSNEQRRKGFPSNGDKSSILRNNASYVLWEGWAWRDLLYRPRLGATDYRHYVLSDSLHSPCFLHGPELGFYFDQPRTLFRLDAIFSSMSDTEQARSIVRSHHGARGRTTTQRSTTSL